MFLPRRILRRSRESVLYSEKEREFQSSFWFYADNVELEFIRSDLGKGYKFFEFVSRAKEDSTVMFELDGVKESLKVSRGEKVSLYIKPFLEETYEDVFVEVTPFFRRNISVEVKIRGSGIFYYDEFDKQWVVKAKA